MKLYMWLSLANFFVFWTATFMSQMCPWKIYDLLYESTFKIGGEWNSLELIILTVMFQSSFSYTAVVVINICLCHDLIYTLRDPFRNPEARYKTYAAWIIFLCFSVSVVRISTNNLYIFGYLIQALFIIYIAFAISSVVFACRYVRKPGISAEAR